MQQIVRRYTFTAGGLPHDIGLMMRDGNLQIYADDKLVGSQRIEGNKSMHMPFTVDVPGMPPVSASLAVEHDRYSLQYKLCVHNTLVQPWWTAEHGDIIDTQPPEVLDASSLAHWEVSQRQKDDQEDLNIPHFQYPNRQQLSNSWFACCTGGTEVTSRPRSARKNLPEDAKGQMVYDSRPIAKTCNDGSILCREWGEELFA
mmetsp:Transcript_39514/g.62748  ORF Transcript_39514/g.62748 Transcript_39514/m.62748 type:complete len:201 (-) Transcript_39514:121-723(-)|eukprot:CAMPEP_0169195516 /NCGR_PEP_ID=MMETSP1016-20121227/7254_1 /TAXON_ID=342587 /ORGANISM="Karlodinium micrum, Strain CCMP2283" /LENGTH=200 /DNA_ID=CAMNT_0009272057 /DNA_START=95 /DNA_END=697 /DNA_ORIENTATION=+